MNSDSDKEVDDQEEIETKKLGESSPDLEEQKISEAAEAVRSLRWEAKDAAAEKAAAEKEAAEKAAAEKAIAEKAVQEIPMQQRQMQQRQMQQSRFGMRFR